MDQKLILGIDIGGTHITVACVDLNKNIILPNTLTRVELDSKADLESIMHFWTHAILHSCSTLAKMPNYIGIAMPGPMNYEKGICMIKGQDKYGALFGLNIKELLASRLQINVNHIGFVNDAVAFLSGEILGGAARNGHNVIGLTLGTGLGSAKMLNEESVTDADLWKMPFKNAIAEEYLSTRWFVKSYFHKTAIEIKNVKELFFLAEGGDTQALEVFKEFGVNLGLFLHNFIALTGNIDTVVLGGSIAKSIKFFKADLIGALGRYNKIEIHQALLAENAALLGAAGLWKNKFLTKIVL